MMIRNGHDCGLVKEKKKLQPLVGAFRGAHEGKIEPAGQQARQQADRLFLDQLHGDVGLTLAEIMQEPWQKPGGGAVDGTDANDRGPLAAARAKSAGERIGLRQQRPRFLQQHGAIVGQRDAARRARHQPRAEIVFEQPDEAAERRRQHVEPLRRPAKMQFLGRRHEAAQLM